MSISILIPFSSFLFFFSIIHVPQSTIATTTKTSKTKIDVYAVWAVPPEKVGARLKKLQDGLRSEFGGPQFDAHLTVVGIMNLTKADALKKFRSACDGQKAYHCSADRVVTGNNFYQSVYLLLHPTPEVLKASAYCSAQFGYKANTPYMPHMSLLYADLTEDEKKKALEKVNCLDESIDRLRFPITRLALWITDSDRSLKNWVKVAECNLSSN